MTTDRRTLRTLRRSALPLLAAGMLALSACSSSGRSVSTEGTGGAAAHGTVEVAKGGRLTDATGRTLYVSDQERHQVLCTSDACTSVWTPLSVGRHDRLSSPGRLQKDLATIRRPDGTSQVALDGRPLYTFSLDHGAGQVNGDGATDSFDGHHFTWHVAMAPGAAADAGPGAPSTSSGGGYGY